MTGTDLCVNKPHKSRSYLNHLVHYGKENYGDTQVCNSVHEMGYSNFEYCVKYFIIQRSKFMFTT